MIPGPVRQLVGTLTCANGTADVGVLVSISVGVLVGASVGALVGASVGCKVGIVVLVGTATIPVGVGTSGAFALPLAWRPELLPQSFQFLPVQAGLMRYLFATRPGGLQVAPCQNIASAQDNCTYQHKD